MWLGLGYTFHPTVFSNLVTSLPTAVFVEDTNRLFDSHNSVKHAAPGKTLHSPLSDSSPHVSQWTKATMGIKSWIFLKNGKPAFKKPTASQNGWIIDTGAVQHVWRMLKRAAFDYL
jgi:hypothetical protein